jgi:hypothetical protein
MQLPKLTNIDTKVNVAGEKRQQLVNEAITWPKGEAQDRKISKNLFSKDEYTVRVSKPGKEAAHEYDRCKYKDGTLGNNPNDMRPEITIQGKLLEKNATFGDIFDEFIHIHAKNPDSMELLGYILGRNAYMADHFEIEPRIWRYRPQPEAVSRLSDMIGSIYGGIPIEVFIHYLESLALNEDVKYYTLGYDIKKDTGRRNNLLTCVHLIAVLKGDISIAKFAGGFARPPSGLSAISKKKMYEAISLL